MKEAARADESATRGISPPGAPPTSSSTVTIPPSDLGRRIGRTDRLPSTGLPLHAIEATWFRRRPRSSKNELITPAKNSQSSQPQSAGGNGVGSS